MSTAARIAEERSIPFDLVPRIISNAEWQKLSRGIEQRVRVIDALLHDIYRRQEIIRAGRLPKETVVCNDAFLPQTIGVRSPGGIYTHIVGIVPVRTGKTSSLFSKTMPAYRPVSATCLRTEKPCCGCSRNSSARTASSR